ncbi:MAG: DUF4923 family protein [Prevotella sp.]|nr:DUF4923 family protein [Prevotella sp.]
MKRVICIAAMSMGLMFSVSVSAQSDLGGVLKGVLGGSSNSSSSSGDDIISSLTSVFSSNKQAKESNIVGTWNYSEPAIVLSSNNILTKAAAKVAANKVESKLQSYLTSYGIAPGSFSMTFKEDGTFTETLKGRTTSGTWKIADSKLQLTIASVKTISITTQIDGKDLQFVTDATKLLTLFKTIGAKSTVSSLQTITSLMKNVDGMQAGITLRKQ